MASSAVASSGARLFDKTASDAGAHDAAQQKPKHSFGTGRDTSGWLGGSTPRETTPRHSSPRGRTSGIARSEETSKVFSSFGGTPSKSRAGTTMGGGSRFAPVKTATAAGPGDYYTPPPLGAAKSSNFNKSSNGTMGTSKRFGPAKEVVQSDYSSSRPGAFERSKSTSGARPNTGFGGTAARVTGPQVIEKSSTNLSYDGAYTATGAFAKATRAGTTSAAFASKSVQRTTMAKEDGPAPGAYNAYGSGGSSSFSSKSFNKSMASGSGGFGTSVKRTMDMGKPPPEDVPGPGEYAPDVSDATPRAAKPSAAFASTTAKCASLSHTSGPSADVDYDAHANDGMAASVIKTFNKSASGGSMMGSSQRFVSKADVAPGPGEYRSTDGAFSKSRTGARENVGFGGTAARVTVAEQAARAASSHESNSLSYDNAYATTGAFAKATRAGTTSAAFASKSVQRTTMAKEDGPAPGAYNAYGSGGSSSFSSKSFNKSMASGSGGFGTSVKRTMDMGKPPPEDVPGPGEYAPDVSDATPRAAKPSAAFASTTAKGIEPRNADAPSAFDYDSHAHDGMADVATRSFNRHVGTGSFGSKAARPMHEAKKEYIPGAGEYDVNYPHKATVEASAKATKGRVSGAFASTTLRDTSNWATSGSKFLP